MANEQTKRGLEAGHTLTGKKPRMIAEKEEDQMVREKRGVSRASEMKNKSEKKAKVDGESAAHNNRAIIVTADLEVLECDVCFGPLTPPLYQCISGHMTCSACFAGKSYECQCCNAPKATIRCRAMENLLAGVNVPCSFTHKGRTAMVPFNDKKSHDSTCVHSPCYCPIRRCSAVPYSGVSLLEHLERNHPEIGRTCVSDGSFILVKIRDDDSEPAHLVYLTNDDDDDDKAVFLLVVDRSEPPAGGRSVWMVRLKKGGGEEEVVGKEEFKYSLMVMPGNGDVLSMSGETVSVVGRLTAPYRPNTFLFVPGTMLVTHTDGLHVCAEIKSKSD